MAALVWPRPWATVLRDRRVIRLVGAASIPLLNGLVSSNVAKLKPGDSQATAFLSAQGRVAADALLVMAGDSLLVDCHHEDVDFLMRHISTYKLRAKFEIQYHDSERVLWLSHKAHAEAVAKAAGHSVLVADPRVAKTKQESSDSSGLGWRLFASSSTAAARCPSSSADDVAAEASHALGLHLPSTDSVSSHALGTCIFANHRRLLSVFEGPNEVIRGSAFPLECNFDVSGAVAFDKGCYIGQELTARTKFRGEVRKRLFCLEHPESRAELLKCFNGESALELKQLPARASPLYIAGTSVDVGRVVSDAVSHPSFSTSVALLRVAEVAAAADGLASNAGDDRLGSVEVAAQPDAPVSSTRPDFVCDVFPIYDAGVDESRAAVAAQRMAAAVFRERLMACLHATGIVSSPW